MKNKLVFLSKQYSLPKMLIVGIVLILVYVFSGIYVAFSDLIGEPWNRILYAAIAIVIAILCAHYSRTTKVLAIHVKQGKFVIYTICIILFLGLIYIPKSTLWIQVFKQNTVKILSCFFTALAAGICEEFLFRDLFFNFFIGVYKNRRHILFLAAVTASFFFALMHLVNLYHQNATVTLEQVCVTFSLGIVFCVFHILSNTMWVPVLMHFLYDFAPMMNTGISTGAEWSIVVVAVGIILAIYLIWLWLFNRKVIKSN